MNPLESYLSFSEARRGRVYAMAAMLIGIIAYSDWKIEEVSVVSVDLVRIRFLDSGPGVSNFDALFKPFERDAPGGCFEVQLWATKDGGTSAKS